MNNASDVFFFTTEKSGLLILNRLRLVLCQSVSQFAMFVWIFFFVSLFFSPRRLAPQCQNRRGVNGARVLKIS